ncbi:hypothetical protein LIER_06472 [Lithospermum erythrorhizon]|uniref:Uncharacterized protein n=1 Tax=Lithospermum erythrorhizon TaxID=34254 RepID=A0AAV3P4P4_LITER
MREGLGVFDGFLFGIVGAPRLSMGARVLRAQVLTTEIAFPYLPLYSQAYRDFIPSMADNNPTGAADFINAAPGMVQRVLEEVRLACLAASVGCSYLLEGKIFFSPSSSPLVHYSGHKIVVVLDLSNVDIDTQKSGTGNRPTPPFGGIDKEVGIFVAGVITEPNEDVTEASQRGHVAGGSVQLPKKRKRVTTKKLSDKCLVPAAGDEGVSKKKKRGEGVSDSRGV